MSTPSICCCSVFRHDILERMPVPLFKGLTHLCVGTCQRFLNGMSKSHEDNMWQKHVRNHFRYTVGSCDHAHTLAHDLCHLRRIRQMASRQNASYGAERLWDTVYCANTVSTRVHGWFNQGHVHPWKSLLFTQQLAWASFSLFNSSHCQFFLTWRLSGAPHWAVTHFLQCIVTWSSGLSLFLVGK